MGTVVFATPRLGVPYCEFAGTDEFLRSRPMPGAQQYRVVPLPTDPVGFHELTLTNVVDGSHIWIGTQDGTTTHYNQQWGAQDYTYDQALLTYDDAGIEYNNQYDGVISLPVYVAGSALNDWRIRIRKATTAPYYIPYETRMTATVGSSSIYVSQISDE